MSGWQQHPCGGFETSTSSGKAYPPIETPTGKINRLMRDLRIVESRLEAAERHSTAIRRTRDAILAELQSFGD